MGDYPYPVLEERSLPPVPRKWMRGSRRELAGLPDWRLGCVFVFHTGQERIALREHTHLTGSEEAVVDAVAVSVVDVRPRMIQADIEIPSVSAADDFHIHAKFRCQVTDPEIAAGRGPFDLSGALARHLARDHMLLGLGASRSVEEIAEVRHLVSTRVEAYWEYHAMTVSGLTIALAAVQVLTPGELRVHQQNMRDERWRQDYAKLANVGEDAQIERMRGLVDQGSDALTAVGLVRREIHPADAVRDAREKEQNAQAHLLEALRIMQQSGHLDYARIDADGLVSKLYEQVTGHAMPELALPPLKGTGADAVSGNTGESDSEALDEADLND